MDTDLTLKAMLCFIQEQQIKRGTDYSSMSDEQKISLASSFALALNVEVSELASSWNFAPWKTTKLDRDNIQREIIDCLFFLAGIASCFDISVHELEEKFFWVLQNNARRMESGEHKEVIL